MTNYPLAIWRFLINFFIFQISTFSSVVSVGCVDDMFLYECCVYAEKEGKGKEKTKMEEPCLFNLV